MSLTRSPLHDRHVALGAKLADFSGWDMPIEYAGGGVIAEHTAVRKAVGLFDVSHLGKATVRGPGAVEFLNSALANDLGRIGPGQAQYTLCCDDPSGGVVDDLIAYIRADDDVLLVPNAANTAEVVRRLAQAAPPQITVQNAHRDYGVLAVQGPQSAQLLDSLGLPTDHDYMSFTLSTLDGHELIVCRTGYTGEHGYELLPTWDETGPVWDKLLAAGSEFELRPCPRHVADRNGLPAARPRAVAVDHPGAGARRLGGRLEEGSVLGQVGAHGRTGGGRGPAAVGPGLDRPWHPPTRHERAARWRVGR
jgi:aminomethyltransferase